MESIPETTDGSIPSGDKVKEVQAMKTSPKAASPKSRKQQKQSYFQQILEKLLGVWRGILSLVPGTQYFRQAICRRMAEEMKTWHIIISAVISAIKEVGAGQLEESALQTIQRRLEGYERILSPLRCTIAQMWKFFFAVILLGILLIFLSTFGSSQFITRLGYQGKSDNTLVLIFLVVFAVFVPINLFNSVIDTLKLRGNFASIARVSWPALIALTAGYAAYQILIRRMTHADELGYFIVLTGLIVSSMFLAWLYGLLILASLIVSGVNRLNITINPEAMFAHSLLMILVDTDDWVKLENRVAKLVWLEMGATCLEKYLPPRLTSGDPITDVWLYERTREIATGLRSLKKWVLMPRYDTANYFEQRVLLTLRDTAMGNWDALYREAPEILSRPKRAELFLASIVRTSRMILAATGPVLILWGLQHLGIAIPETTVNYLTLGGILWIAISVLLWIDPNLKEKLDVLTSLKSLRD